MTIVARENILVDTLRIAGFRGIKNLEITFAPMTVLIGMNNSGKTTILKALGLALGDYGRYIADEDFFIGDNEKKATEIIVDIRIVASISDGQRINVFDSNWQAEFGDKIKAEANGSQYVAIRVRVFQDKIKGGFQIDRATMERWPNKELWLTEKIKLTKLSSRFESLPFFSIEAQRDIHQELRDKSSFIGKVLSEIKYDENEIIDLEKMIKEINEEVIDKSKELQLLKNYLTQLNQTFQSTGSAEITPFPKKIRDLSKNFSVHFGETAKNTFTMEYHGMGTRSWASMLTVKAFIDTIRTKYEEEIEPFYPILAAEEPEAHLHPNAQKTLYQQLSETNAQIIVSTHSPYIVAMSDVTHLRLLIKTPQGVVAASLECSVSLDDKKKFTREILMHRGEILFSRALILFEGITEEQVIPAMFEAFSDGRSMFSLGVSCINVGSVTNYSSFIKLACSFGIPTFIISDNDNNSRAIVEKQINKLKQEGLPLTSQNFGVSYCNDQYCFEQELVNVLGLIDEIREALFLYETNKTECTEEYKIDKKSTISALSNQDILGEMSKTKAKYSAFLSDVIKINPNKKTLEQLVIKCALDAFTAIKGWIQI